MLLLSMQKPRKSVCSGEATRKASARYAIPAKLEHSTEIKTQAQPSGTIKNLKELKAPYAEFNPGAFAPDPEAFGNIKA